MDEISLFDADSPLCTLLAAVESGRDVFVLRDGKPVARLVCAKSEDATRLTIGEFRALRDGIAARQGILTAAELEDFRHDGRR